MGLLNKYGSTLYVLRDMVKRKNPNIFDGSPYDPKITYNGIRSRNYVVPYLQGVNIDVIEENDKTVAFGIPINQIKILSVNGVSLDDYRKQMPNVDCTAKFEIEGTFSAINKSTDHIILFRLRYDKSAIEKTYDKSPKLFTVELNTLNSLINEINLPKIFPYKNFLTLNFAWENMT